MAQRHEQQYQPSLSSLSSKLYPQLEPFQTTLPTGPNGSDITISGVKSRSTNGPPLLMLHGYPQNHLMWAKVASSPAIHTRYTLIIPDLRGYGGSSKPRSRAGDSSHQLYARSSTAGDLFALMGQHFGAGTPFFILAHDRGARVTHKMLYMDSAPGSPYHQIISRAILLDIAPTKEMFGATSQLVASAYWHWFFLLQPAPFPEQAILGAPHAFIDKQLLGLGGNDTDGAAAQQRRQQLFGEDAYRGYVEQMRDPDAVHAMCEDYRAAAAEDLQEAEQDELAGCKIRASTRVVWGEHGLVGRVFDPVAVWKSKALEGAIDEKGSKPLPCGHYIPEELPDEVVKMVTEFLV